MITLTKAPLVQHGGATDGRFHHWSLGDLQDPIQWVGTLVPYVWPYFVGTSPETKAWNTGLWYVVGTLDLGGWNGLFSMGGGSHKSHIRQVRLHVYRDQHADQHKHGDEAEGPGKLFSFFGFWGRKMRVISSYNIWRFPQIGLPLIHFHEIFSLWANHFGIPPFKVTCIFINLNDDKWWCIVQ